MRAIQYRQFGSYEQLQMTKLPTPQPTEDEVLIQMLIAGVSPLDNTVRAGHFASAFHKPLPIIPGVTGVGVIVSPGASSLPVGTRVMIAGGGGYGVAKDGTWQEYLAVRPADLLVLPDAVSNEVAAALSTGAGYLTAYLALTELVDFVPGQTVLTPGVSGAVGSATMQIAQAIGASLVISTARTTEKVEQARQAGFEHVIDLSQESLHEGVMRLTGGTGVNIVIDGVAGPVTGQALASLARGGTLVSVGYSGGMETSINVTDLIWKASRVMGFTLSLFSHETLNQAHQAILDLLVEGRITPLVARPFPLAEAAEAQRYLMEKNPFGRVLLTI